MYLLYRIATRLTAKSLLKSRLAKGKEDSKRINERMGISKINRPEGNVIWMHGASVGEVTSLITLIGKLKGNVSDTTILITSGTMTSAKIIESRGLEGVVHQYIPFDHPGWVKNFLDHWKPDAAIIAESEIWPNLLMETQKRKIPAALINARLSDKSYKGWKRFRSSVQTILKCFKVILTQTETDKLRFQDLGHNNVKASGNIKYSSEKLPVDDNDLKLLQNKFKGRPIWVYASSHADEESLACEIHEKLMTFLPNILTVIVPRHPERRQEIIDKCDSDKNPIILRSAMRTPPENIEIYVIDTLGELGLFYRLADIAIIGRTFSTDGGGGHNPIEAAQLDCAVLHGPLYQNLREIFDDMHNNNAAMMCKSEEQLYDDVLKLFLDYGELQDLKTKGKSYTESKAAILDDAFSEILDILPHSIKVEPRDSEGDDDAV